MTAQVTSMPIRAATASRGYGRVMVEALPGGGFVISVPVDGICWKQDTVVEERGGDCDEGVLEGTILRYLRGP